MERANTYTRVPRDWMKAVQEARLAGYDTPIEWALAEFEQAVAAKLNREPHIARPFEAGDDLARLRAMLCDEEGGETRDACMNGTLHDVAKETTDMDYVSAGTKLAYGIPWWPTFWLVHENNMQKIGRATVREDGKLVKAPDHPKIDLSSVLKGME